MGFLLSVLGELTWCHRISKGCTTGVKAGLVPNGKQTQHWNNKRKIKSTIISRIVLSLFSLHDLVSGVGRKFFGPWKKYFIWSLFWRRREFRAFFFSSIFSLRYKIQIDSPEFNRHLSWKTYSFKSCQKQLCPAHITSYMKSSHMFWKSTFSECWGHLLVLNFLF